MTITLILFYVLPLPVFWSTATELVSQKASRARVLLKPKALTVNDKAAILFVTVFWPLAAVVAWAALVAAFVDAWREVRP